MKYSSNSILSRRSALTAMSSFCIVGCAAHSDITQMDSPVMGAPPEEDRAKNRSALRICTELIVDPIIEPDVAREAYEFAVAENPANRAGSLIEAAALGKKRWNPERRILNVDFLEEPQYLDRVIEAAKLWEQHMALRFRFGRGAPDVLVAFDSGGSNSRIGTDSRFFAKKGQRSMNFGWFDNDTKPEEIRRTTVHEFGHALSLIHEHNHPDGGIPWNKKAVYAYYFEEHGWDAAKVDRNIFAKYDRTQLVQTAYDRSSIMHYPIRAEHLLDASFAVGWNTSLSQSDKDLIGRLYPGT